MVSRRVRRAVHDHACRALPALAQRTVEARERIFLRVCGDREREREQTRREESHSRILASSEQRHTHDEEQGQHRCAAGAGSTAATTPPRRIGPVDGPIRFGYARRSGAGR